MPVSDVRPIDGRPARNGGTLPIGKFFRWPRARISAAAAAVAICGRGGALLCCQAAR